MRGARFACTGLVALAGLSGCANLSSLTGGADAGQEDATSGADGPIVDGTTAEGASRPDGSPPDSRATDSSPSPDAGVCTADPCVMATGLNHPYQVVSDANRVYWTEFGTATGANDGSLKSCPVSGCGAGPTVVASGLVNPRGLAVDGAHVYFATASYAAIQGSISSCPLTGCGGTLPTLLAPAGIPDGLVVDQSYVYWVDVDENTVGRVPKNGAGSPDLLYDAATQVLAAPVFCAVDSTNVYIGDSNQSVFRVPLGGGEPTVIAAGGGGVCPIAIDQTSIYYAAGSQLRRAAKTSTDGGPPIATNFLQLVSLEVDGDGGQIYWADFGNGMTDDGAIGRVAADGGGGVELGMQLPTPESMTVSGGHVFWISSGSGVMSGNTAPNTGALTRVAK